MMTDEVIATQSREQPVGGSTATYAGDAGPA